VLVADPRACQNTARFELLADGVNVKEHCVALAVEVVLLTVRLSS